MRERSLSIAILPARRDHGRIGFVAHEAGSRVSPVLGGAVRHLAVRIHRETAAAARRVADGAVTFGVAADAGVQVALGLEGVVAGAAGSIADAGDPVGGVELVA